MSLCCKDTKGIISYVIVAQGCEDNKNNKCNTSKCSYKRIICQVYHITTYPNCTLSVLTLIDHTSSDKISNKTQGRQLLTEVDMSYIFVKRI